METLPRRKPEQIGRNPEVTRNRILDAALQEFAAHGFAGARVDVIARAAHINKRMLYHYFGDKEALFREILRRKITARAAWLSSAPENLWQSVPAWFELMGQDPEWIRLLQWEALQWGEKATVIDEDRRRKGFKGAIARIREQQSRGEIPAQLDAGQLLLSVLALTAYPFAFPQLTRLATGLPVSAPAFRKQREAFLREFTAFFATRTETLTDGKPAEASTN